jgi:CheY-like chemotaxis protein
MGDGENKRILVLDDDPDILNYAALHLRKWGYEVSPFHYDPSSSIDADLASIRKAYESFRPNLVLSDYNLTEKLDGFVVFKYLRPLLGKVPFIVWTQSHPEALRSLQELAPFLGVAACIEKPSNNIEDVRKTLEHALAAKK